MASYIYVFTLNECVSVKNKSLVIYPFVSNLETLPPFADILIIFFLNY